MQYANTCMSCFKKVLNHIDLPSFVNPDRTALAFLSSSMVTDFTSASSPRLSQYASSSRVDHIGGKDENISVVVSSKSSVGTNGMQRTLSSHYNDTGMHA